MQENTDNLADLVEYGIKCCNDKGVEYADVKYMHTQMENISFKNNIHAFDKETENAIF